MANKTYSGYLKMIGNATINNKGMRTYTLIEIGEHHLKGVRSSGLMDNYLSKALNNEGDTILEITGVLAPKALMAFIVMLFINILILKMATPSFYLYLIPTAITFGFFVFAILCHTVVDNTVVAVTIDGKRYTN